MGLKRSFCSRVAALALGLAVCAGAARAASIDPSVVRAKEKEITAELAKRKLTPDQKYAIYLEAGREFENYRLGEYADKYYAKAIREKTKLDQSEPYLSRVKLAMLKKDKKAAAERLAEAKRYLGAHPKFQTDSVSRLLAYFDSAVLGKSYHRAQGDSSLAGDAAWREVERLIRQKKYAEALDLFNPAGLAKGPASQKVIYDLLNVLVKRRKAGALLCGSDLKTPAHSGAWSLDLCAALDGFLKTGKLDSGVSHRFASDVAIEDPDHQYLVEALDDLRKEPSS